MRSWVFLLCALFSAAAEESPYLFAGKHFLASYLDCDDESLRHLEALEQALDRAVEASGATLLDKRAYTFEPDGLTAVYLLSESHASIHTYPEYRACFVDLFTCGEHCSAERFDQALQSYLRPRRTNLRYFLRNEEISEISYPNRNL